MKSLNKSAKAFIGFLSVSSMVMAGVYSDMRANSNDFMNDNEIQFVERLDDTSYDRIVASAQNQMPGISYLPAKEYSSKINGFWEVYRIQNDQEERIESESKTVVKVEMNGTSSVVLNNDASMEFETEMFHEEDGVLELVRTFGKGFEKIWAKRIENKKAIEAVKEIKTLKVEKVAAANTKVEGSTDLTLERALNPVKSSNIQIGEAVSGSMVLESDRIEVSEIIIAEGSKEEARQDAFEAKLENGAFVANIDGEEVSGLVTSNGKNAYRIRFMTGSLKGALLNYATDEEVERLEEQRLEEEEAAQEISYEQELAQQEQEEVATERKNSQQITPASNEEYEEREAELEEEEENYSDEQVLDNVEETGVKF